MIKQKRHKRMASLVFVCCIFFALCLVCIFGPSPKANPELGFDTDHAVSFCSGWQLLEADGTMRPVTLPAQLKDLPSGSYTLVNTLPETLMPAATLCMRSSMQTVSVSVDGQQVYHYGDSPSQRRALSPGSVWCLTRLPEDSGGKEISITLSTPLAAFHGVVNPIQLGSKTALLYGIIGQYGSNLLLPTAILLSGIVMIVLYLLFRFSPLHDLRLLYLALFALSVSLWLIGESRMVQFFTGNWYVLTNLSYLALMAFPLPLLLFIDASYRPHHRRFTRPLLLLFTLNIGIQVLLQLCGVADYFSMLPATHGLIAVSVLLVTASLVSETVKYKNREAKEALLSLGILFVFGFAEIVNFLLNRFDSLTRYLRLGIFFYICVLGFFTVRRLLRYAAKAREAQYLEQLAYHDLLTQGKNRNAYDNDCRSIFSLDDRSLGRWLLLFDLNNLKIINDTYGHNAGDDALRAAYRCIVSAFHVPEHSYRIGGDEFACILTDAGKAKVYAGLARLRLLIREENDSFDFEFDLAVGFEEFDPRRHTSFDAFVHSVDKRMYDDKHLDIQPAE